MKNLTWQNPEQLFVAQELINKVKSKCCGIKVYITTPAGYLTDCEQTIPRFYQEIDLSKTNEYNFRLKKNPKDDSKHLFVLEADVQAGLKEHWDLYAPIVDDYKQLIDQHTDRDVFGLNCGDIFWDTPATFFPPYIDKAKKLDIPIYRDRKSVV